MTDTASRALLPEGLHDTLAPDAGREARSVGRLLACFDAFGYDQVAPPMAEFEDTLLAGVGAGETQRMFRLMDPVSKRMMGIRTDITTQIARIATTRLAGEARPLRLCYAGQVLRVVSPQVRAEREVCQAGLELVGDDTLGSEVEVLSVAAQAVMAAGVAEFTVDITLPQLTPALCASLGLDASVSAAVREALDAKDMAALGGIEGVPNGLFQELLNAAGPADSALEKLAALDLPGEVAPQLTRLQDFLTAVRMAMPDLVVTIDPGEYRNFEYHTGLCFTFFAANGDGELGRGGRYEVVGPRDARESAVGFTVYVDTLLRSLSSGDEKAIVYIPAGTPGKVVDRLHGDGWRTRQGFSTEADARAEAANLGCTHILTNKKPEAV